MNYFYKILKFIFLGITLFGLKFSALGQTYTPSVTGDIGANSLRDAITQANGEVFNSTIYLESGNTYILTSVGTEAGNASFFDLDILDNGTLTIETINGTVPAIIQANFATTNTNTRIFDIQANARLILNNIIVENGAVSVANGGGISNDGGTLELLSGTIVRNNSSLSNGGGVYNQNSGPDAGRIIVNNSSIINNQANGNSPTDGGGGIFNNDGVVRLINGAIIQGNTVFAGQGIGGGVKNTGPAAVLRVKNSSITGNTALRGGGIFNGGGAKTLIIDGISTISLNSATGTGALGAGIFNTDLSSLITILSSTVTNNFSDEKGGGIFNQNGANLVITCASIISNTALTTGGGIANTGSSSISLIRNSLISQNRANQGGGIHNSSTAQTFIIKGSVISLNSGTNGGGGIFNTNSTLIIASSTILSNEAKGGGAKGAGIFTNNSTLTIICSSILSNASASDGGGIRNQGGLPLLIQNSFISLNSSNSGLGAGLSNQGQSIIRNTSITYNQGNLGAGIFNGFGGTMSLTNGCIISYNVASSNDGGGIAQFGGTSSMLIVSATITNNTANNGGGIFNKERMNIRASSICNNIGGGVYHEQSAVGQDLNITNSTISSNSYGGQGAGLRQVNATSIATLTHVTIANNTASNFGGIANSAGTIQLQNSIVANNTPNDVQGLGSPATTLSSIVADGSVTDTEIQNIDPKLDILQVFSGSLIHRLLPASPALNVGTISAIILDQIGTLRNDGFPDIGAYEGILPCVVVTLPTGIDTIWLGCISSDWLDGNNWSQSTVPSYSDVVLLLSGSPDLIINTNVYCRKIIAQKGTKYYVTKGNKIFFTSP